MTEDLAHFQQRLFGTFLKEAQVHIASASALLGELERDPDRGPVLYDLLRAIHSLKGAANAVEQEDAAFLCRSLEQVLHKVQRGERQVDPDFHELFRQGLALLQAGLAALADGGKFTISLQFLESVRKLM
ncbi:MAG TPA: Hpt domain-containing protein [Burkholderiaceae bacterium]